MTTVQSVTKKIELLSEKDLTTVSLFIDFIKTYPNNISKNTLLSENSLAKDWLSEEEETAWQDL